MYFRMPFSWKTPVGYLITFLIELVAWFSSVLTCTCILSYLIGVCLIIIPLVGEIEGELHSLNNNEKNNDRKDAQNCSPIVLKKKLIDIVQFHANTIELSVVSNLY